MMADHAGFAAAITLRERVLNDALLLAYSRPSFSRVQTIPFLGAGPSVILRAFLSPPTVTCDPVREAIVVSVDLPGALTVVAATGTESRFVRAHVEVAVPATFALQDGELRLAPALTDLEVVEWSYTVVGNPFTPTTDALLRSQAMAERLATTVRVAIEAELIPLPSVDISALGAIVDAAAPDGLPVLVRSRVVDGALVAGLDVTGFVPPWQPPGHTGGITLHGQPFELEDFAGDYDLAVATNPEALPILLAQVQQKILDGLGSDQTLDSLVLTAEDGFFGVAGRASNDDGHATFSFEVVPRLDAVRPGKAIQFIEKPFTIKQRAFRGLWFSTENPHIDASTDFGFWKTALVGLLSVVTFGIMLKHVLDSLEAVERGFRHSVAGGTSGSPAALVHRVTSPSLSNVALRIAVEEYTITPDGPFMGVTITPEPKPAALIGPQSIPANLLTHELSYTVRLPIGVVEDDLELRVQWTVIDTTTGTLQFDQDTVAQDHLTFTVVPKDFGAQEGRCSIGARVYRDQGGQVTEIFNDVVHLFVGPVPDGPAYIAWDYDVLRPWVTFDPDAEDWTYFGDRLAKRHSKIHRVGVCNHSRDESRFSYRTTKMFVLPFPAARVDEKRFMLCDYCFYGGPGGLRARL
jgi:hypothetical protein